MLRVNRRTIHEYWLHCVLSYWQWKVILLFVVL